METPTGSTRVYTGPLSQAAMKVLAALRAQSSCEARLQQRSPSQTRKIGRSSYSAAERVAPRSGNELDSKDSHSHGNQVSYSTSDWNSNMWTSSPTPADSQNFMLSQSSTCSSPCWGETAQRNHPQAVSGHLCSLTFSRKTCLQPLAYMASQTLLVSQQQPPVAESSSWHQDRSLLYLQVPSSYQDFTPDNSTSSNSSPSIHHQHPIKDGVGILDSTTEELNYNPVAYHILSANLEVPEESSDKREGREECPVPTFHPEEEACHSGFEAPCLLGTKQLHENDRNSKECSNKTNLSVLLMPASPAATGQSSEHKMLEAQNRPHSHVQKTPPTRTVPSTQKSECEVIQQTHAKRPCQVLQTKHCPKWAPPQSCQKQTVKGEMSDIKRTRLQPSTSSPMRPKINSSGTGVSKFHAAFHSSKHSQTTTSFQPSTLISDARIKDSGKLSPEQRVQMLEEAEKATAVILTLVFLDGTTQLDPEQKLAPPVCGLLTLMMNDLHFTATGGSLGPNHSLLYSKLEHKPLWAQQQERHTQEHFARDLLLRVLSRSQLVVCYKSKDVLRTALQCYKQDFSWKQVAGCQIHDPQISGWLLDPADASSCFRALLRKHCKTPTSIPSVGAQKVSQIISSLYNLFLLNQKLCVKLQELCLWRLYSEVELQMIPVLAVMESHRIHVDKDALKRMSNLLGNKMKQLEQEAHRAAGQIFLVTSSAQLRTVLFEKLRLHERCENKKLPKTINKQQQSTSEAALQLLQDLHPLPKIILEYRQVHKIKSAFVDGILSCMKDKNYISSTWVQTSVVTGRISAKHPNFQALPKQPLQISKKLNIHGKEEEVVFVHARAMFIPQEGWTFLSADFCQVELRLLAHFSSDPELLRIFTNPQSDVFTLLASKWKGVSVAGVTLEDREQAKRIVYSVVYGAGRERLSSILGVSAEQASRFQDSFLQTYRELQPFIQRTIHQSHKQGFVVSLMGRRRDLPNINSPDRAVRMQAERQAVNFVVQGSAADLCKMAMITIFKQITSSTSLSARLLAQLHDELLFEVEDSQVEEFAAVVRSNMESIQHIDHLGIHLKVPLKVSVSCGKSWGTMSELCSSLQSASP